VSFSDLWPTNVRPGLIFFQKRNNRSYIRRGQHTARGPNTAWKGQYSSLKLALFDWNMAHETLKKPKLGRERKKLHTPTLLQYSQKVVNMYHFVHLSDLNLFLTSESKISFLVKYNVEKLISYVPNNWLHNPTKNAWHKWMNSLLSA
jgi:hypothetical protein